MNNTMTAPANAVPTQTNDSKTGNRLAGAAFVCGIVGLILNVAGFAPGLLGIGLIIDARRRGCTKNVKAARTLCILSMILSAAVALIIYETAIAYSMLSGFNVANLLE